MQQTVNLPYLGSNPRLGVKRGIIMNIIEKARRIAEIAHENQFRNFTKVPYIKHPSNVASYASYFNLKDYRIAAVWLHDVIEDCGIFWKDKIQEECGNKVLNLVLELTNPTSLMEKEKVDKMSRAEKFEINFNHLITISKEAKEIKLLDIYDNLSDYKQSPVKWLKKYILEKEKIINHPSFQVNETIILACKLLIGKIRKYLNNEQLP